MLMRALHAGAVPAVLTAAFAVVVALLVGFVSDGFVSDRRPEPAAASVPLTVTDYALSMTQLATLQFETPPAE